MKQQQTQQRRFGILVSVNLGQSSSPIMPKEELAKTEWRWVLQPQYSSMHGLVNEPVEPSLFFPLPDAFFLILGVLMNK
jgi:hypothetical protein